MRKPDASIHNIVVAAIRRKSIEMPKWELTRLWDEGSEKIKEEIISRCDVEPPELAILYCYIDQDHWTMFSTRAIYYLNDGEPHRVAIETIENYHHGDFKGYRKRIESMRVQTNDGT